MFFCVLKRIQNIYLLQVVCRFIQSVKDREKEEMSYTQSGALQDITTAQTLSLLPGTYSKSDGLANKAHEIETRILQPPDN